MQSLYGMENVYREECLDWGDRPANRSITEPKCLYHLKVEKSAKKKKKIQVTCPYYRAFPSPHWPTNFTVFLKLQTNDRECEQIETIEYYIPEHSSKATPKCKKPKWNKNGITVARNLSGPRGIYIDQYDNLYVADLGHRRLQKFPVNGSSSKIVAGSSANSTNRSVDVCIDSAGNIFAATGEEWIVKSRGGGSISSGNSDQKDCVFGVFLHKKKDMYVAEYIPGNSASRIRKYSSKHLQNSSEGKSDLKQQQQRYGVFIDQCDSFATANVQEDDIKTFLDKNYSPPRLIVPTDTSAHLYYPSNILNHFGNYYIVGRQQNYVMKLGEGVIVGVQSEQDSPPSFGFGFELNSNIQVSVLKNNVRKELGAKADAKHLNEPITIAFDSKSNLYVSDFKNNRVQKFLFQS
ncbi:unnamed protein product, partial [Didymodactylos carnosus]